VYEAMTQCLAYTNTLAWDPINLCTSLAKFHTYFEATHPFADGNGRTGRVLLNYILVAHGYPNIIIK
jgi:Fic family protein